ncbi:hypothetical protein IJV79_00070 [bacterium]|nr:hypothetical protein [bacterium]
MLVFGEIIALKDSRAKLKLYELDEFETDWFFIPQLCTVNDKSFNTLEIGTEVAAITNGRDGCIIGALYNEVDTCPVDNANIKSISFSDGSSVSFNKEESTFDMNIKSKANITAPEVVVTGDLKVSGNITSSKNISGQNVSDAVGTMQEIRARL